MAKELLDTPRAVVQRKKARMMSSYVYILEQLEFCVRHKVDPVKYLEQLDAWRKDFT